MTVAWILNSLSTKIDRQIVGDVTTAHSTWMALQKLCGAQSRARRATKQCLNIFNVLVSSTLAGLDSEYLPIVTVLEREVLSWPEMHDVLLNFEAKLKRMYDLSTNLASLNITPAANTAYVNNQTSYKN
ncbi:hypothetical protein Syun_027359 [Stephania yunnanensis]|uniref:Uncharacterized protein n=1 Tax=Stephania yunnanensis TaxID=152371 RepID=A0AAP0EKY4_9MAGN